MKLIIAGSRIITDKDIVLKALQRTGLSVQDVSEIVSGGAKGVDTLGEEIASDFDIPVKVFPAEWSKYGKRAGMVRNGEMARYADALLAVWDGQSTGTQHMVNEMEKRDKIIYLETLPNTMS